MLSNAFFCVQETLIEEQSGDDSDPDSPIRGHAAEAKPPDSHVQLKPSQSRGSPHKKLDQVSPSRLKRSTARESTDDRNRSASL